MNFRAPLLHTLSLLCYTVSCITILFLSYVIILQCYTRYLLHTLSSLLYILLCCTHYLSYVIHIPTSHILFSVPCYICSCVTHALSYATHTLMVHSLYLILYIYLFHIFSYEEKYCLFIGKNNSLYYRLFLKNNILSRNSCT